MYIMDKKLKDLYENFGFPAITKLYQLARSQGLDVTLKDIENFEKRLLPEQIHEKKKPKKHGHITASSPYTEFQMDLLDMSKYSRKNSGMKWILICIDIFTRYAWGVAIKSKSPKEKHATQTQQHLKQIKTTQHYNKM